MGDWAVVGHDTSAVGHVALAADRTASKALMAALEAMGVVGTEVVATVVVAIVAEDMVVEGMGVAMEGVVAEVVVGMGGTMVTPEATGRASNMEVTILCDAAERLDLLAATTCSVLFCLIFF